MNSDQSGVFAPAIRHYLEKHGFEALCPKAVLFDMDGVLYDSMPNHAVAWQQSMASFDIQMTAQDAYATEGARGVDTIRSMVRRQQGREIDERQAQLMYDEKTRLFHDMPAPPVMPGVLELMEQIHNAGLLIGVVTGSGQRPLIGRLLKDFGQYLDEQHIVTAYDVSRGKPHPDPYLMGLQKAGSLAPWQALIVENAPLGVRAGVAARVFTIAVNTGPLAADLLAGEGANLVFDSMPDLTAAWQQLQACLGPDGDA
jgi:HAD superfamily hydrolase (TIGR01509 family)